MVFRRFSTRFTPDQRFLGSAIAISGTIFFAYASLRHFLLRSTGYDLGIYDNMLYRLSQGHPPQDTFLNYHFLADHLTWLYYPISLLYRIHPTVYWLFVLQAFGLACAVIPLWKITQHHQLTRPLAQAITLSYCFYPLIFNINLFDFHSDVFAPLFLLTAIAAFYQNQFLIFLVALIFLCGCKAVFSLTVIGLGLWLTVDAIQEQRQYHYGIAAITLGLLYFGIATQVIIPAFGKANISGFGRYANLGTSLPEVLHNLVFKPQLVWGALVNLPNLKYLFILLVPLAWAISHHFFLPLLGAAPALLLNFLTPLELQKNLTNQYSLPIVPFLLLGAILTLANQAAWLRRPRWIIAWSLACFMALGKPGYILGRFVEGLDTWSASRDAIALIDDHSPVLVPMHIAPHVTHRLKVGLATDVYINEDLRQYKYVMLDKIYPGIHTPLEIIQTFQDRLEADPQFELEFERDQVYLYQQKKTS